MRRAAWLCRVPGMLLLAVLVLIGTAPFGAPARAQDTGAPEESPADANAAEGSDGVPEDETAAFRLSADEVRILDVAVDNHPEITLTINVPAGDGRTLTESQIVLAEDGLPRSFALNRVDDPTAVILAIDVSGSMAGNPLVVAQEAALAFIDALPRDYPVGLVTFGDTVAVPAAPTTNRALLSDALAGLVAQGETSLYDAVVRGSELLDELGSDRQMMVVLSDGADTASAAGLTRAANTVSGGGINFFAVGLETGQSDLSSLTNLTVAADGRFAQAANVDELREVYDALAARGLGTYRLTYETTLSGPTELYVGVDAAQRAAGSETVDLGGSSDEPASVGPTELAMVDPPLAAVSVPAAPGMGREFALGIGAMFAMLTLVAFSFLRMGVGAGPRNRRTGGRAAVSLRGNPLKGLASAATNLADRGIGGRESQGRLNRSLERAGLNLRSGEFVVLVACATVAAFAAGSIFIGPRGGVLTAALVALGAPVLLEVRYRKNRARFAAQLDNTLLLLSSTLRAGHGVQRALAAVAQEVEAPTGPEFARVIAETRLGRDLIESLNDVGDRIGNEDFTWVVRAIEINRELGGNLSEVLQNVGDTIRQRNQLRGQVKALSAEGKMSAIVLYVLPFGIAGFVKMTNPGYLNELTGSSGGQVAIGFAILLMILGGWWITKIVKVRL